MLSTTDAPQDQGARQHAAPEEDADSDDEPIVIPAKSPEAIVDLTSEESSEEINQAELFRSENPVLQAALNSKQGLLENNIVQISNRSFSRRRRKL